jgi:hypothetical protein
MEHGENNNKKANENLQDNKISPTARVNNSEDICSRYNILALSAG